MGGDFVWIDHAEIVEGEYRVTSGRDVGLLFSTTLDQYLFRNDDGRESRGGYYRPLYALSLSLDWALWGATPWLFHVENLLWHLLVVLGLFRLGRCLGVGERTAFWGALLFAVHPLGIHSVTWISGRKDTMCAAFAVGALLAFHRGAVAGSPRRGVPWFLLAGAATLAACLSKELALVLPAAALLVAFAARVRMRSALLGIGIVSAVPVALFVFRTTALGGFGLNADYPGDSLAQNLATSSTLIWEYIARIVVPRAPLVSDAWPIARSLGPAEIGAVLGLLVAAVAVAVAIRKRTPEAIGLAWAAIWLLPATGIVPLRHFRAERYLYPASFGALLALAAALHRLPRPAPRWILTGLAVLAGLTTALANTTWRSDEALFEDAVERDPHHVEGWAGLAEDALRRRDFVTAITAADEALARAKDPDRTGYFAPFLVHSCRGRALLGAGQPAPALDAFTTALAASPDSAMANRQVGHALLRLGRFDEAKTWFARSLDRRPDHYETRSDLAFACLRLGRFDEAASILEPLVAERPEDRQNRVNLGAALLAKKRFAEALPHYETLAEGSTDAITLAKLAWCRLRTGDPAGAREALSRVPEEDRQRPEVRFVEGLMRR